MLVGAAAFGAADQYLGSLAAHPWAVEVSLLAAPWLLLPFLAGCTQRAARRAVLLGLMVTVAALLGYGLMALSPIEGAHLTAHTAAAFVRSEAKVFVAGAVTGPLLAWLGQRWRTHGAVAGPLITAAAFCLEPVGHAVAHTGISLTRSVALAEVVVGAAVAVAAFSLRRRLATPGPQMRQ